MLPVLVFYSWLLVSAISAVEIQDNGCELVAPNLQFFAPFVFSKEGQLKTAERSSRSAEIIHIPIGEDVSLSCSPNYLKKFNTQKSLSARCKGGNLLEINNKDEKFENLGCELRNIEEILVPVNGCPNNATAVEFGFTHPLTDKSYILGEACYDEQLGQTRFVHFKVRQNYKNDELDKVALSIKSKNYFQQNHPTSRYKLDYLARARADVLNTHLEEILNYLPRYSYNNYLRKNLLVNAQFYQILKLPWNYVVMLEETTNILEHMQLDMKTVKTIDTYIGSHGVLKLANSQKQLVPIYLSADDVEQRFPMPEYIWALIKIDSKILVVAVLNTETSGTADGKAICKSKCDQVKFKDNPIVHAAVTSGRIQCCEYKDVRETITEIPNLHGTFDFLTVSSLLQ